MKRKNTSLTLFVLILITNAFVFVNLNKVTTNTSNTNSNKFSSSNHSTSTSKNSSKNKNSSNYKLGLNVFYKKSSIKANNRLSKTNNNNLTKNISMKEKYKVNSNYKSQHKKENKLKKLKANEKNHTIIFPNTPIVEREIDQEVNNFEESNHWQDNEEFKNEIKQINNILSNSKRNTKSNSNKSELSNKTSSNKVKSQSNIKNLNKIKKLNNNSIKSKQNEQSQQEAEPAALKPTDKQKILNSNDKLNIVLEDWLEIASPQFKEPNIYPSVINPDYTRRKIKLDTKNFRINEFYEKKTYNDPNYPPTNLSFWFRYSDKNLYYSNTPETLQVLDSISIKEIKDLTQEDDTSDYSHCIKVSTEFKLWYLCSNEISIRQKWFCQIKKDLGVSLESCTQLILDAVEATVNETKVTQPIILIPLPSEDCNANWNFLNKGDDWECECKEGKEQSPIEIDTSKLIASPVKPVFFYETAAYIMPNEALNGYYKKNDKTKFVFEKGFLSIKHPNFGTAATLDGVLYRAQEVRFYTPSQHSINNKLYDMEVEVIHYGETKGSVHKQLVFSVLFEKYPGVYNKFIDDIDPFNLPNPLNSQRELLKDLHINKLLYNSEEEGHLQLKNFDFFTYQGSLTTPPCTENTIRIIVSEPIRLGSTVLTLFKEAIKMPDVVDEEGNITVNKENLTNNRKTQPLNGRKIWLYQSPNKDSLVYKTPSVERPEGHYEKIVKRHTAYYEISNDQPSGIPGAFVVSEAEAKGNK